MITRGAKTGKASGKRGVQQGEATNTSIYSSYPSTTFWFIDKGRQKKEEAQLKFDSLRRVPILMTPDDKGKHSGLGKRSHDHQVGNIKEPGSPAAGFNDIITQQFLKPSVPVYFHASLHIHQIINGNSRLC